MFDLITVSIGIGLVVSLIFSETLGKSAGGLVVPGYVAIYLTQPVNIVLTFAVAFATYAFVASLSRFLIIFGKRRTVLTLLTGFALGAFVQLVLGLDWVASGGVEFTVIGYLVPSLIAIWMDRQGWFDTCTTTITAAVVVRLALILVLPGQVQLAEAQRKAAEEKLEQQMTPSTPELSHPMKEVVDNES